jgi:hypothetical protein
MSIKQILVAFACTLLCVNAASSPNLVQNPGFDEDHSGCTNAPSWTQFNATNNFNICAPFDWWMVSQPNAMYLNGLSGWAGAVQRIEVDQTEATSFNFSCMYFTTHNNQSLL